MPVAIAPVIIAAGASLGITVTATAASIIAYGVVTAAALGVSLLLTPKREASSAQMQVKQAIPVRQRGYGRAKLGGAVFFMESFDGDLYRGLVHCEGLVDGIEEWWWNDTVSYNGAIPPPWGQVSNVETYNGSPDQTVSPLLLQARDTVWTPDHRLKGLCYSAIKNWGVKEKNFQKHYPNGAPNLRIVARLSRVYDPRNGTVAWSDNPALCILDYLVNPRGYGLPASRMDYASFAQFANICDEIIPTKDRKGEKRYRLNAVYELTDEPRAVLQKLLATCDAEIIPLPNGTMGIRGGIWQEPTVTISDPVILSYNYEQGNDKLSAFNQLKLSFTSPDHDYQLVETQSWDDAENQVLRGEVLSQDLALDYVPSHGQARRLAKIAMAKGNPRHKITLVTNMAGLDALGERVVYLNLSELGIASVFHVDSFEISGDFCTCTISLSSLTQETYMWDAVTEEGEPPPPVELGNRPYEPPPMPTITKVEIIRDHLMPNVISMKTRVTVAPLEGTKSKYKTIGRYKLGWTEEGEVVADSAWARMSEVDDWIVQSDFLQDGKQYEIQVAHAGWGGWDSRNRSWWTPAMQITAIADTVLSEPVTDLHGGAGVLIWTRPNSGNYAGARIYRSTTDQFVDAVLIDTTSYATSYRITWGGGSMPRDAWYFVDAFNESGLPTGNPPSVFVPL